MADEWQTTPVRPDSQHLWIINKNYIIRFGVMKYHIHISNDVDEGRVGSNTPARTLLASLDVNAISLNTSKHKFYQGIQAKFDYQLVF